jgi:wobble nucleotide-excising tRNase
LFILTNCSSSETIKNTTIKEEEQQQKQNNFKNKISKKVTDDKVKICEIERLEKVKDCSIFTLFCEDNSKDYYILCEIEPIGIITNPPQPIDY